MGARHFTELECWQLANDLRKEVLAFTAKSPAVHERNFCDDIRRSARSAPSNVAEGFGRYTHREFAHFLSVAHASLVETENHLIDAHDSRYLTGAEWTRLTDLAHRAQKATSGLRTYLLATPDRKSGAPRRPKPGGEQDI
jgi:four helix bundle protein